jgi:hypothetical protein
LAKLKFLKRTEKKCFQSFENEKRDLNGNMEGAGKKTGITVNGHISLDIAVY